MSTADNGVRASGPMFRSSGGASGAATPRTNPGPAYEYLPGRSFNIRNTPSMGPSQMTREGASRQAVTDDAQAARHDNIFHRHADKHYHNTRPMDKAPSLWNEGYVASRGLGHHQWAENGRYYDPLLKSYKGLTHDAINSAPESRPIDETKYNPKMGRGVKDTFGTYNPVTAQWQAPRTPRVGADYDRAYGKRHGGEGVGKRTDYARISQYDPITGIERSATTAPPTPRARPATGGYFAEPVQTGKNTSCKHLQGTGTFDPMRASWKDTPTNTRFWDRTDVSQDMPKRGKPPRSPNTGVYDPIRNDWIVPPQNPRVVMGMSFQPATCFMNLRK